MREIKFRIWDPKEKRFYFWSPEITSEHGQPSGSLAVVPLEDQEVIYRGMFRTNRLDIDPCGNVEFVWQQFTGLHDKNGKEIYEGDVVVWRGWEVRDGRQIRPERKRAIGIDNTFITDCFHMQNIRSGGELEVIGNIYENPELLEKK